MNNSIGKLTKSTILILSFTSLSLIIFTFIKNSNFYLRFTFTKIDSFNKELIDKSEPELFALQNFSNTHLNYFPVSIFTREQVDINQDNVSKFNTENGLNYYEVVLDANLFKTYYETIELADLNKNKTDFEQEFIRISLYDQSIPLDYIKSPEDSVIISDFKFDRLLSNKDRIPAQYQPFNLVDLSKLGITTIGEQLLDSKASEMLVKLNDELKKSNIEMIVSSAYRSYQDQTYTYNYIANYEGEKDAEERAATPGFSEHQLGLAVDLINSETKYKLPYKGQVTKLYTWLQENAYKFGFIQTYKGQDDKIEEPWHWRYIGIEKATELFETKNEGDT